jgi:hypothetical protein
MEDKMARIVLALIGKLGFGKSQASEDAVFAARLSTLSRSGTPRRARARVSPFRYVAPRAL